MSDLPLEYERWHPWRCPCGECDAELNVQGAKPVQTMPDWFLEKTNPELLASFKGMRTQ